MGQHNGESIRGVTIRDLAGAMGVAYQTVQRWIEPGGMPVLRWDTVGGRRFARLDMNRCIEWARVNRPALSGVGRGGWRQGSGRAKKDGTKQQAARRVQTEPPSWFNESTHSEYRVMATAAIVARTKLKQLRHDQVRSQLLDRAEAEYWWGQLLQRFTDRLGAIPADVADAFAREMGTEPALRAQIAEVVGKELAEALATLGPTPFAAMERRL